MQKLEKLNHYQFRTIIYGPSKSQKTRMLCTFPDPIGIIDSDNGLLSIKTDSKYEKKEIYANTLNPKTATLSDLIDAVDDVLENQDKLATIGFDSLSTGIDIIHRHVLAMLGHRRGKPKNFEIWEATKEYLIDLLSPLLDVDCNFVAIAHEEHRASTIDGRIWILPMLIGEHRHKLGIYFDEVWHTENTIDNEGNPITVLQCVAGDNIMCGTRLGLLDFYEPDFEVIAHILREKGIELEPPKTKRKGGKR